MWKDVVGRKEVVRAHALAHAFRHPAILQNGRPPRVHSSPLVPYSLAVKLCFCLTMHQRIPLT